MASSTSQSVANSSAGSGGSFFRESIDELKKVTTPTRAETIQATLVTMVIIVFLSICLAIIDAVFNWVMGNLV